MDELKGMFLVMDRIYGGEGGLTPLFRNLLSQGSAGIPSSWLLEAKEWSVPAMLVRFTVRNEWDSKRMKLLSLPVFKPLETETSMSSQWMSGMLLGTLAGMADRATLPTPHQPGFKKLFPWMRKFIKCSSRKRPGRSLNTADSEYLGLLETAARRLAQVQAARDEKDLIRFVQTFAKGSTGIQILEVVMTQLADHFITRSSIVKKALFLGYY